MQIVWMRNEPDCTVCQLRHCDRQEEREKKRERAKLKALEAKTRYRHLSVINLATRMQWKCRIRTSARHCMRSYVLSLSLCVCVSFSL